MKPRTWTALFVMALAAWVGLAGMIQQAGNPPVAEAYTPADTTLSTPQVPAYTVATELHAYLAGIAPHRRSLTDVAALERILVANPLIIDVRNPTAYAAGHIPGAVNIPLSEITSSLDQLPTDRLIVVSCDTGLHSAYAAAALEMLGFANVYDFMPGFTGWATTDAPVSTVAVVAPTLPSALPVNHTIHTNVEQFFAHLPADGYGVMQATSLEQLIVQRDALVVDLRNADAFAAGRIPGSINIPLDQLGANLDRLPFDRPVVLSCNADAGCGAAAPALHMLGFGNVRVFPPSFAGWEAANLLVER